MRGVVREGAQDRPGVYRMLSPDGEVVYVGKSKKVRTRLLSYFRCAYPEDKGARILREATTIDWEYTPSEFSALLAELRLIKRLRPRFNVAMKRDARHYAFISSVAVRRRSSWSCAVQAAKTVACTMARSWAHSESARLCVN
jgi:excinuclease ABC subunit C